MMLICIGSILNPEAVAAARATLGGGRFVDGRSTAGWHARGVKDNLQADPADARLAALRNDLAQAIAGNELFQMAVRPRRMVPLLLSRYEPGMRYGSHVDDALMRGMRSDVSFTLFLSPMESYEGGELVIETASGEDAIKLEAGSMVVYPATTLHRVNEVTRGERLAAVGWVRSFIRDAAKRELLFDLDTARKRLFARDGKSEDYDLLSKSSANLLRMWAED